MKRINTRNLIKKVGAVLITVSLMFPMGSFAGTKDIYVDAEASGTKNGSEKHPYKTISDALEEADDDGGKVEIHVANGTYKENIVVSKEVKIIGEDNEKVIIDGDDDKAVVKLNHKSEINKVTIKDGKYGVVVDEGDGAVIINCIIKDNRRDAIKIERASIEKKYTVSVIENSIYNNGGSGIYSEKRKLSIENNDIYDNDGDGIDIEGGSAAWIHKNKIRDNDKSGMKLTLDGSDIWTRTNTIRDNEREGIEIETYGGAGRIDIKKSKIYKNDRYGIAKVQRGNFSAGIWGGLTVQGDNILWKNSIGDISGVLRIY